MSMYCSAVSGSDYITVTIEDSYYSYQRKYILSIYTGGEYIADGIKKASAGILGATASYTFDNLDSETDYVIYISVYIYEDESYTCKETTEIEASTTSDVVPEITDIEGSYSQGTVLINVTVYCSDKSMSYYVIISNSSGSTTYDYAQSANRSSTTVTVDTSFDFDITGTYQKFYVYLCPQSDTDDCYERQSIKIYPKTRSYFSWDSNSLLDDKDDVTDDPISVGDLISDYLTAKKWTLLQECVNEVYKANMGIEYDFTAVTTSTVISAELFNEVRTAIKSAGASTSALPSTVSSGDEITASLFNKLQYACNSVTV